MQHPPRDDTRAHHITLRFPAVAFGIWLTVMEGHVLAEAELTGVFTPQA